MSALIRFKVSAPNPHDHLYHVRMEIDALGEDECVDLSMPVWSPGSYLVREYSRHVQNLRAVGDDGDRRRARKLDKATWQVDASNANTLIVEYEVFAHDVNVRANHLDDTHGFFTGVALYLYPQGREDETVELEVVPPDNSTGAYDWQVYTGLERIETHSNTFVAPNFDVLYDSPVEMGDHDPLEFEVDGKQHQMIFWGSGNVDRDALARDLPKVVEANRDIFGGLPYDDYLFITLLSDGAGGGLEHLNSTALIYPRHNFGHGDEPGSPKDGYLNFLGLVCHEHFHVWNVKRIRPAKLGPFDYQKENYTRDLWTVEGVTSYYDTLGLLRAGVIDADGYLTRLAKRIKQYEKVPGRKLHSLEEASFDAWIKLYRADEHTRNSTISYYLKGELVCALLDLHIRHETDDRAPKNKRCLDDVLRHLWKHHYLADGSGYPEGSYEQLVEEVTGVDVTEFFDTYIRGTDDFDWDALLAPFGLQLERSSTCDDAAWLGVSTETRHGQIHVTYVPTASPAHRSGIYAGDEICAVDGWKITGANFTKLIEQKSPGETAEVHLFRRGELRHCTVELGSKAPDTYRIRSREDASDEARTLLRGWIGTDCVDAEYSG
jgi:predicted metalloprotease with PDZ domain